MRVGIISLIHESNTFIQTRTDFNKFKSDQLLHGEQIKELFTGGHHEISGFLEGLKNKNIEAIPIFHASTSPSGTITKETCKKLMNMMFREVEKAGNLDGILAAPHGANAGEGSEYRDLDGYWLTRLRKIVGPGVPIICTIDPHANLSKKMIEACDATIAYRTNPHLDQKQRGLEAVNLIAKTLLGEIQPTQAAAFPRVAINIECQLTSDTPCRPIYEKGNELLLLPGVLSNSVVLGFPYADVEEMGSAFIVVTNNDLDLAQRLVNQLAAYFYDRRKTFLGKFTTIENAINRSLKMEGPVCLLDMGDNVGGGSAGDGTLILHELYRKKIRSFLCLFDPQAVQQTIKTGVGNTVQLQIGGKTDDLHGPPLEAKVRVCSLHDGTFQEKEVRHGGRTKFNMGLTAIVETGEGITLSLTSRRIAPVSLGLMTSCGLNPSSFQILVAKGVHSPLPAFAPICKAMLRVDTSGSTTADMRRLKYIHRRRPLYPFEEI